MDGCGHLPVVVALAAAPEEEAALAALGVVVVLGAAGPAAAHVRRQVAPGERRRNDYMRHKIRESHGIKCGY